ncbi:MAG TPA: hypothetical protein VEX69_02115 [Candidatus Limnocylindria bacterium]|nr:hypothetical protein [Candidatus Limnocylindria bacterium]
MRARSAISTFVATLTLAGLALASVRSFSPALTGGPPPNSQLDQQAQPPSDAELHARTDKLIANQHADDIAIEEYERIERHVDRTGGSNQRILEDKSYRIVPTGPGTLKILLHDNGKVTDPADYRKQLQTWRDLLQLALNPNDPRIKAAYAKLEKKKHDRADLVNAARDAFNVKWVGQENLNGHDCDVIQLDPNPAFHPRTTLQEALTHANAKIWVDHNALQILRAEAHIVRDVSFGGGILGKLYRGGVFFLEQAEVAPGVWLPTRYQYDYTARKFLFTFEQHQFIEASHYRRLGPPKQALLVAQSELANGEPTPADP